MDVSIITVSRDSAGTIEETIRSVLAQTYAHIEYIVVDGASRDGTMDIAARYKSRLRHLLSEPDHGIYDAMNKGIRLASGEVIGILNSDDFFADPRVVERIAEEFSRSKADCVFSDLLMVDPHDTNRVIRYYDSSRFTPKQFAYGLAPAHPTFFVRRACYERYGYYKTDYVIAADFELLARFLARHKLAYSHLDAVSVRMRRGGVSGTGLATRWINTREKLRACRENGIETNAFKVLWRYPYKLVEFVRRPPASMSWRDGSDWLEHGAGLHSGNTER